MIEPKDDPLMTELRALPREDVTPKALARIRAESISRIHGAATTRFGRRVERFWTEFMELPASAMVVFAYLFWVVHTIPPSQAEHSAESAVLPASAAQTATRVVRARPLKAAARATRLWTRHFRGLFEQRKRMRKAARRRRSYLAR